MLAELKIISSCPTRYLRDPRDVVKSVDRQASTLPREYTNHARDVDREYGGVAVCVVGPLQAKLLSFPPLRRWVFGAWGEAYGDIHLKVDYLAEARQKHQQLLEWRWRSERKSQEPEVALYTGQIWRQLSLKAVRSQARLLLERLGGLGAGAAAAAKKRDWAEEEECRMGRERRAHQLALTQGRPVRARGQVLLSMT